MAARREWLPDATATQGLGGRLAAVCNRGGVVFLSGDLGAGKTTLARGLLRALGHRGAVRSPTFTLVEPYELQGLSAYHFDLYRLADPEELELIGARDYFVADALCLVEWPERGAGALPEPDLRVELRHRPAGREALLSARSERGAAMLDALGPGQEPD